jgi:adenylosuccinate lyase
MIRYHTLSMALAVGIDCTDHSLLLKIQRLSDIIRHHQMRLDATICERVAEHTQSAVVERTASQCAALIRSKVGKVFL